jgi:hypothetical protein
MIFFSVFLLAKNDEEEVEMRETEKKVFHLIKKCDDKTLPLIKINNFPHINTFALRTKIESSIMTFHYVGWNNIKIKTFI